MAGLSRGCRTLAGYSAGRACCCGPCCRWAGAALALEGGSYEARLLVVIAAFVLLLAGCSKEESDAVVPPPHTLTRRRHRPLLRHAAHEHAGPEGSDHPGEARTATGLVPSVRDTLTFHCCPRKPRTSPPSTSATWRRRRAGISPAPTTGLTPARVLRHRQRRRAAWGAPRRCRSRTGPLPKNLPQSKAGGLSLSGICPATISSPGKPARPACFRRHLNLYL